MDIGAMGQNDQNPSGALSTSQPIPSSSASTASTTRVCGLTQVPTIDENETWEDEWSGWYDDSYDEEWYGYGDWE